MAESFILYSGPLVSLEDALTAVADRYFTGKPCCNGHVTQRWTHTKRCTECERIRREEWKVRAQNSYFKKMSKLPRELNPNRASVASLKWRDKNLEEVKKKDRERWVKKFAGNPQYYAEYRAAYRKRRDERLVDIAGRPKPLTCDICGESGKIVFDHCHKRGQFRGWLCDRCNWTLGHVKDDPELLRKMAGYLEKNSGKVNSSTEEQATGFFFCWSEPQFSG